MPPKLAIPDAAAPGMFRIDIPVVMSNEADPGSGTDHRTVPGAVHVRELPGQVSVRAGVSGEAGTDGDDEQPATAASVTTAATAPARRAPACRAPGTPRALMSCSQAPGRGETAVGQHSGPNAAPFLAVGLGRFPVTW